MKIISLVGSILACTVIFALPLAAEPVFFPLNVGHQWIYQTSGVPQDFVVVEVVEKANINEEDYFLVSGLADGPVWLRLSEDGTLLSYSREVGQEVSWIKFSAAEGEAFDTSIHPCNRIARIDTREGEVQTPAGIFNGILSVNYPETNCADAGLTHDAFAPGVGLVERTMTTFAGPRTLSLLYARLGDTMVISRPEVSFGIALDRFRYTTRLAPPELTARITLRVVQPDPIELMFPDGQRFDIEVVNDEGETVYRWSEGKFFSQVVGSERVGPGERNWVVTIPLVDPDGNLFDPGSYTARCWLTTSGKQPYFASIAFEISSDR